MPLSASFSTALHLWSGTDFNLMALQRGLKHRNVSQLEQTEQLIHIKCYPFKATHTHTHRGTYCLIIITAQLGLTLRTYPKGRIFATEALYNFPPVSQWGQAELMSISHCQFQAHNTPWEYIFHVPWMFVILGSRRSKHEIAFCLCGNQKPTTS